MKEKAEIICIATVLDAYILKSKQLSLFDMNF